MPLHTRIYRHRHQVKKLHPFFPGVVLSRKKKDTEPHSLTPCSLIQSPWNLPVLQSNSYNQSKSLIFRPMQVSFVGAHVWRSRSIYRAAGIPINSALPCVNAQARSEVTIAFPFQRNIYAEGVVTSSMSGAPTTSKFPSIRMEDPEFATFISSSRIVLEG